MSTIPNTFPRAHDPAPGTPRRRQQGRRDRRPQTPAQPQTPPAAGTGLVLKRKPGEAVHLHMDGLLVKVSVVKLTNKTAELAIKADRDRVLILRAEVDQGRRAEAGR